MNVAKSSRHSERYSAPNSCRSSASARSMTWASNVGLNCQRAAFDDQHVAVAAVMGFPPIVKQPAAFVRAGNQDQHAAGDAAEAGLHRGDNLAVGIWRVLGAPEAHFVANDAEQRAAADGSETIGVNFNVDTVAQLDAVVSDAPDQLGQGPRLRGTRRRCS